VQITSDGYAPYAPTIRAAFGHNVDYGQLQKVFEENERGQAAARRYSPGRIVRVEREVVFGNPAEDKISTSYVERNNLTIRMQMRRCRWLTHAFSKKLENHRAAFGLHVGWYNLCHLHESLRCMPPIMSGRLASWLSGRCPLQCRRRAQHCRCWRHGTGHGCSLELFGAGK